MRLWKDDDDYGDDDYEDKEGFHLDLDYILGSGKPIEERIRMLLIYLDRQELEKQ